MNDPRGSIWRKWDLHLHTPDTKLNPSGYDISDADDKWQKYCEILEKSDVSVFGITDYFSIDNYIKFLELHKNKYPESKKVFFPNIEFRLDVSVNKTGEEVNIHVIFSNVVSIEDIKNFLSKLETNITRDGVIITCDKLKSIDDYQKASLKYSEIRSSLTKIFGKKECFLIIAASNNQGLRADTKSPRKLNITDEIDKVCDGFFGGNQNVKYYLDPNRYEESDDANKCPVFSGSDAHSFLDLENKLGKTYEKLDGSGKICDTSQITWIKADKTFQGLKQLFIEPESRIYIGEKPDSLYRVEQNPTKYIKSLQISKVDNSVLNEIWFEDLSEIPLNNELVAIIGNKGNGKSALADIIGLLGNTHNHSDFSFLNKDKFRKKNPNRSDSFQAQIKWESNHIDGPTLLSHEVDVNQAEKVKFLPQSFLEKLCTTTDEKEFEEELRKVIFSHVDHVNKLGKGSLDELLDYKSEEINQKIVILQNELILLNKQIVILESKKNPEFKATIQGLLKIKTEELFSHKENRPPEVKEPIKDEGLKVEHQDINKSLNKLKASLIINEEKIKAQIVNKKVVIQKITELEKFMESLDIFEEQITKFKGQHEKNIIKYGLDFNKIVKVKIDKEVIVNLMTIVKEDLKKVNDDIDENIENSTSFKIKAEKFIINELQGKLDEPTKRFQEYKDKLKIWEEVQIGLIGNIETIGTQKYFENILLYLETYLNLELEKHIKLREDKVREIFTQKLKVIELYKGLYKPVTKFIDEYGEIMEDYKINLDVSLRSVDFSEKFFGFVSQGLKGSFIGKDDGTIRLKELIEETNFTDEEQTISFLNTIIDSLKHDKREGNNNSERYVNQQLRQGYTEEELYKFLFDLNYLKTSYKLKLSDKEISELSPGERGALLLIFYLLLDRQDMPLIIDQPEENLDNQSVYNILVRFIKEAKKKRQIIIVTHNPNLAVVCDAEQVINVVIDKANKNKVYVTTGALESKKINRKVVEILEGTFPAFNNRTKKYKIHN